MWDRIADRASLAVPIIETPRPETLERGAEGIRLLLVGRTSQSSVHVDAHHLALATGRLLETDASAHPFIAFRARDHVGAQRARAVLAELAKDLSESTGVAVEHGEAARRSPRNP